MANTKSIKDREARKTAKREQRKALKAEYVKLTKKQRKEFRRSETVGLRAWLAEQAADAE